jgi:hypothetical protein
MNGSSPRQDGDQGGSVVADVEVSRNGPFTCASAPPSAASMAKVSSSRVGMSMLGWV